LLVAGAALLLAAAALLIHDLYRVMQARRGPEVRPAPAVRGRAPGRGGLLVVVLLLPGISAVVQSAGVKFACVC
jgi:hypothetical protein